MEQKQCIACGLDFLPCPQVPSQCFCSAPACQKERRRRWQRDKLKADPDYQDNQNRAQQAWIERNPDYWRQYRETHPDYLDRNRQTPNQVTMQDGGHAALRSAPPRLHLPRELPSTAIGGQYCSQNYQAASASRGNIRAS